MNLRRAGTITLTGLLMLGGAAVFAIWYRALGAFVLDDTFISLRYASHLAAGQGLVYNVGERVEGYTNFLWTVMLAPPFLLNVGLLPWVKLLNAGVTLLAALTLFQLGRRTLLPCDATLGCADAALPAAWLLATPVVAISAAEGLETLCFTL
jgi:hypothetical protein